MFKRSGLLIVVVLGLLLASPAGVLLAGDEENVIEKDKEKLEPDATEAEKRDAQKEMTIAEILAASANESGAVEKVFKRRVFHINDIIFIEIDEKATADEKSSLDTERKLSANAAITEFLELINSSISKEDALANPEITLESTKKQENEGEVKHTSSLKTNIAATIKDVKPNGNLVISASSSITINENVQEITLTGTVSAESVSIDNRISSNAIAEKKIIITGDGPVSDAAKRGLIQRLFDLVWPF